MERSRRSVLLRLERAVAALDEAQWFLGEEWDEEQWDAVASARQVLRERIQDLTAPIEPV